MSRRCELSGVGPMVGNRVSHSNIKTKRRYEPNLVKVTLASDSLKREFKLRITAATLRSVDHRGGLDAYLLAQGDEDLSPRAVKIKREIKKAAQTEAAA
ncbi:MAG: 50S ribosomal protein L28 [Caulobacterales bacterium]